jgi:hypothetical protein
LIVTLDIVITIYTLGEFVLEMHPGETFGQVCQDLKVVFVRVRFLEFFKLAALYTLLKVGVQSLKIVDIVSFEGIEEAVGRNQAKWDKDPIELLREQFEGLTGD